jgi:hypothetical protein
MPAGLLWHFVIYLSFLGHLFPRFEPILPQGKSYPLEVSALFIL